VTSWCTKTPGLHNDGCDCAKYIECPGCGKKLKRTTSGRYRKHGGGECDFSETVIREEECDSNPNAETQDASSAESPPDDAPESAPPATPSTPSSPPSPEPGGDASTASAPAALPGVEEYAETLGETVAAQREEHKARVEANLTPFSQPAPVDVEQPPLFSQPASLGDEFAGAFSQPAGRRSEQPAEEMTERGKELTARLKEMFYAYDNRRSEDNRSAQVTMGPSEMGTPCDRRLALSLMRMPPVNPGGDGWAAFVGTCIHAGLEQMFLWANAGTGRFAVETRLEFDNKYVPKGTADLIDRTLFMLDDHKCQGRWSRNKLKSQGPSKTYRVQAHVYAYGAKQRGEKIDHVAIISWPRDEATLDDLYVWTEPYNPQIVKDAFARVDKIGDSVGPNQEEMRRIHPTANDLQVKALVGQNYNIADDCRFCPFYLPNARSVTQGCNGKR
jgi:hypothetical protein